MSRAVDKAQVPQVAVPRLARYLSLLKRLDRQGVTRVSSRELAARLGANAAQIRKDLSYFGEFGVRGVGYDVKFLISELSRCLGVDRDWNMVILGSGRLGTALARYRGFQDEGFKCVGMFDIVGGAAGKTVAGHAVRPIEELRDFIRENDVQIAVVAVPAESAVEVAALAAEVGIKGILNFAPVRLPATPNVFIHQLDLSNELMVVSFYLSGD
ncbi:MAG: redox-sensing transcriptional repressor Rex [Acidobacteria bacterium RBG_16_64_8]|nr:MAG: redox-sensing transcriptional repressor Rex [Acidobacteria bacterium RBG_16_64_8]